MARFGRITVVAALCALSHLLLAGVVDFVSSSAPSYGTSQRLRSRVSLAASQAEVDAAQKAFQLQKWAADKLATEGSPMAAAAAMRAQQAEATYNALQAELDGQPAPAAASPVAAAPVAAAPAAAPVAVTGAVSDAELDAAKKKAQLLSWAAEKLASEGSPMAATAASRAQQAEAAYASLQAAADGQPAPAAVPAAVAPVAAAPVAAPVAVTGAVSDAELAEAKKKAQLLSWAAQKLATEGSPLASAAATRAQQAEAEYAAMEAVGAGRPAPAAVPAAAPAVAAAPAAAAPVMSGSAPSEEDVKKAKATMDLHLWAADQLASKGAPEAAAMKAKAEQSRQAYEALLQQQELVAR